MPALLAGPFLRTTLANFFFFLSFASYFLLPLHIRALGGAESAVGAVMGAAGLASLAVLPLVGLSIDRLGRRVFLMLGAAGMTAASAGFLFVDHIGPMLFFLRMAYTTVALLLALRLPGNDAVRVAAAASARRLRPIHWVIAGTMTLAG